MLRQELLTVLHQIRHSKDHDHRHQRHKYHRTLQETHDIEATAILVELLDSARSYLNRDLAFSSAERRAFVAPFIASEGLPYLDLLHMICVDCSFVASDSSCNVDTERWEEVVSAVEGEEVAGFREVGEDEGVVSSYGRIVADAWWTEEHGVCGWWECCWVG